MLNLNEIEIPFGDYLARETPRSECIADLIVKGLFYRKVKFCRLQMLVLPKDTREGQVYQLYLQWGPEIKRQSVFDCNFG